MGGGHFFPNGKFHGGSHFWTVNLKEGVKNTYKMLEIPWEGGGVIVLEIPWEGG